ncbi:MAG: prepilin-type N-terminal cleavage/methylation domain-containing protein, partial [Dehalococcoidales bacterium]|nr:prepilin-type N-terminal cleavage/methylation domain-containing protein [Dehalococcoidales bacterium]
MKDFLVDKKNGVTLVEIMMVTAVMGVLFIGLFSLINKVTKGTWQIGGSLGMNSAASETMYWIGNDFRNAKASTMGGQLFDNTLGDQAMNPSFEYPLNLTSDIPAKWASLAAYGVSRVSGPSVVRSGFLALGLPSGTSYYSQVSTTTYTTREYVVSGWTLPAGTAELRLLQSNAVDTNFPTPCFVSTAATTNWMHMVTTTTLNTNTPFKFRVIFPGATINWFKSMTENIDAAGRDYAFNYDRGLGVYKSELYMADKRDAVSSQGPVKWDGVNKDIWGDVPVTGLPGLDKQNYYYNVVPSMNCEYNGVIYAFRTPLLTYPNSETANMYTFDGTNWALMPAQIPNQFHQGSLTEGRSS